MAQRNEVASFIRTAFALATGRLAPGDPELAARNGLAAFETLPRLLRSGQLRDPAIGIEEFSSYDVLAGYLDADLDDDYLSEADQAVIVAASEAFFTDVIADAELIPMSTQDRATVLASMVSLN